MQPTIYVITYHRFNHEPPKAPIDDRFLKSDKNYIYYLIDEKLPESLKGKKVLFEKEIDPLLYEAGGKYLAEWTFLLAEAEKGFCHYPFYMISSRFYQKNEWLMRDLNQEWDRLFSYFNYYGWGYLPSYDRPLRWIDLEWKERIRKEAWNYQFFPFTDRSFKVIEELYGVRCPEDYAKTADLFCNYIGFKTRQHLLDYVNFYKPLFEMFFDKNWQPKQDLSQLVRYTGSFRNEKPFTFLIEYFSHLFFYKERQKYFTLHYDGYYEVDEHLQQMQKLTHQPIPFNTQMYRLARWTWRRTKTEGTVAFMRYKVKHEIKRMLCLNK